LNQTFVYFEFAYAIIYSSVAWVNFFDLHCKTSLEDNIIPAYRLAFLLMFRFIGEPS